MTARRIFYTGRVQGVGFRYSVKQISSGYETTGIVRNLPDGRVECLIQGAAPEVEGMQEEILKSHLKGFIKEVQAHDVDPDPSLRGFQIAH